MAKLQPPEMARHACGLAKEMASHAKHQAGPQGLEPQGSRLWQVCPSTSARSPACVCQNTFSSICLTIQQGLPPLLCQRGALLHQALFCQRGVLLHQALLCQRGVLLHQGSSALQHIHFS